MPCSVQEQDNISQYSINSELVPTQIIESLCWNDNFKSKFKGIEVKCLYSPIWVFISIDILFTHDKFHIPGSFASKTAEKTTC